MMLSKVASRLWKRSPHGAKVSSQVPSPSATMPWRIADRSGAKTSGLLAAVVDSR